MDLHIREATPDDAETIVALIGELAAMEGETSPLTAGYAAAYLSRPGVGVLLAEEAGQALGLLSYGIRANLYHAGDTCVIDELVVREDARGRGVGSALLRAVISRAQAAGCAEISVSTMPDNARAIAFYRQHGFTDEAVYLEQHF
ncbi:MAG: GNAT family N-acetyltransferase [Chloroflexi bacterium]|jgi:ribosomal protein S18 acetylase RimI-like enzyme|nr:GNAT family N-acetyltransferase [Chloroflexota bacterium]